MVVSSAVSSASGRSVGTWWPPAATRSQNADSMVAILPPSDGVQWRPALILARVPTMTELVRAHTDLDAEDVGWLQLLLADWQIIADLSFADLVLWLPDREGNGYWAVAQMRPTTGPTAYVDDLVGAFVPKGRRLLLDAAYDEGRIAREGDPEWRDDVPVRVETIPVIRDGAMLAVIARNTNLLGV